MRQPPKHHIEKTAIQAWRWTAIIFLLIPAALIAASVFTYISFSWPWWVIGVTGVLFIIDIIFSVILLPMLRWRRWRYEVFDQEIYIQYGILIRRRTIVPMIRVQHVDTKQGPILKRFALATVTVSTAATTHEIPALSDEGASELRDRISELARVDQDDV